MRVKTAHDEAQRRARDAMIAEQIEARGLRDPSVLAAMKAVPRERFVSPEAVEVAYADRALAIDERQTISQPYIVALMTGALGVQPSDKVLEVGTGSGYQAAVLSRLTDRLFTIERIESLHSAARDRLGALGVTGVSMRLGDGTLGWPEEAPFDGIIVTAAAPRVPESLLDQLAVGGRLVIPVGDASQQTLVVITRRPGRIVERPLIPVRFVKLLGANAWQ